MDYDLRPFINGRFDLHPPFQEFDSLAHPDQSEIRAVFCPGFNEIHVKSNTIILNDNFNYLRLIRNF
ncbi:hypothetical protein D3C85_1860190 [compost metagenome]